MIGNINTKIVNNRQKSLPAAKLSAKLIIIKVNTLIMK